MKLELQKELFRRYPKFFRKPGMPAAEKHVQRWLGGKTDYLKA